MASAFKDGHLKKNPLLGTSFGTNPERAQDRDRFMSLYKEAKTHAGEGREGMQGRLAGRYAKFAEANQKALGNTQAKYEDLQRKAANARSPEEEERLRKKLIDSESKLDRLKSATKWKHIPSEYLQEYTSSSKYDPNPRRGMIEKMKQFYGGEAMDTVAAQEAYEQDVADKVSRYQSEGAPLAADMERRQHSLQQRIADYNLFLGIY